VLVAARVITGAEFTFTISSAVDIHPFEFVPETEYVVVTLGETNKLVALEPLLAHVYVETPLTFKVTLSPGQMPKGLDIDAEMDGQHG
jgi:hypothetical protein